MFRCMLWLSPSICVHMLWFSPAKQFTVPHLQMKQQKSQPKAMMNRPLPLPPNPSKSPQQSRHNTGAPQLLQQSNPQQLQHPQAQPPHQALLRHSLDDYHLPRSSSSQIPLSSNARSGAGNVVMRDSPKRRQPRPMSEIATSSSGAAGPGVGDGRDFTDQQQQQQQILLNNFGANFSLSTLAEVGADGNHSRKPSVTVSPDVVLSNTRRDSGRKVVGGDDGQAEDGGGGDGLRHFYKKSDGMRSPDPGISLIHQNIAQSSSSKAGLSHGQLGHSSRLGSYSEQETLNISVPRYQNDSPFQSDRSERVSRQPSG